jgi:hypothetical protein
MLFVFAFAFSGNVYSQELPPLVGDGIADDTAAIQARLDSGKKFIYLPEPIKNYVIKKALVIHSDQTLKLDPQTIIRLADNACDYMLTNDRKASADGNKNIRIIGGIWDGNNLHQTCPYRHGDRSEGGLKKYMGNVIFLMNIEHLHLEGLTIKDPETFGVHLAKVRKFTVKDIVFDYNMELINEDGIHIKGPSSEGLVQNVKGNTNDDMVALNADDQPMYEPSRGPITDIRIDGVWADNGFTAIRLLSAGSPIKRIHISNIFGSYRLRGVLFSHYGIHKGEPRLFEDIKIDHVYISKQLEPNIKPQPNWIMKPKGWELENGKHTPEELAAKPYFWWEDVRKKNPIFTIEDGVTVDNLIITDFVRREWLSGASPTLVIGKNAIVRNLTLRDIIHENKADTPLPFFRNEGTIEHLIFDGVHVRGNAAAIIGNGNIKETKGEIIQKK